MQLSVKRGHSTASMAGQFADSANAKLLVLNHHKAKIANCDQSRATEAEKVITGGTRVLSASDFMEIAIPREGFKFSDKKGPATIQSANLLPKEGEARPVLGHSAHNLFDWSKNA